jgi:hypothetical protein
VFTRSLARCFKKLPDDIPGRSVDRLLDVVIADGQHSVLVDDPLLISFIRSGVLTKRGKVSSLAATWYYNRRCFPGRAAEAPKSLEDLITDAVGSISATRLRDAHVQRFSKEATFQHLFNKAMLPQLLPLHNVIIPESNT